MSLHDKQAWKLQQCSDLAPGALQLTKSFNELTVLQDVVNFTASFPSLATALFSQHGTIPGIGTGIGKGELLLYFLYDDATLGGHSSTIDVFIAGVPCFEVKVARLVNDAWVDFRLGTDEFIAGHHLLGRVVGLALKLEEQGLFIMPENYGSFPKSMLDELRSLLPKEMAKIEQQYFDQLFLGKAGAKSFIFFDKQTQLPFFYGKLTRKLVEINRLSQGQSRLLFKPI
jgi:hypothetical protein